MAAKSAAAYPGRAAARRPPGCAPVSTTKCPRRAPCPAAPRCPAPHRLLERRVGVEAVRVEDVDVIDAHPAQALVEAGKQVLAGPPLAVRPGPHVIARLRRQHELVPVATEVGVENAAKVGLRGARRRTVVVSQVEVRDTEIERAPQD